MRTGEGARVSISFEKRAIVVTGAGNGLGRAYAMALAARGASVIVNDLGGASSGEGGDPGVAEQVAAEIRAAGGQAIANADSVENGEKIIACAMDHFGRVDAVINNAGILRDAMFHKLSAVDWEEIVRVHLEGTFRVTRSAWPHMREAGYGRVVMTTSAAGLYGNIGQANYSAAKLGVHGMALSLAIEGRRKNIRVNSIAPVAASRLTAGVMSGPMLEALNPDHVVPLALLLAHEECPSTGSLFEAGGGWVAQVRWQRSRGLWSAPGSALSPEALAKRFAEVTDFGEAHVPDSVMDSLVEIGSRLGVDLRLEKQEAAR